MKCGVRWGLKLIFLGSCCVSDCVCGRANQKLVDCKAHFECVDEEGWSLGTTTITRKIFTNGFVKSVRARVCRDWMLHSDWSVE